MREVSLELNVTGTDIAGWFFQQDYMTFLAVLGWLVAGLVAWGNAAASDSRNLPWRWFAFFGFLASLDGMLDLAKMVTPDIWPREIEPMIRLAAYGCLLEFSRRGLRRLGWLRIGPLVPVAVPVAALAVVFYLPRSSPVPEAVVAILSSVAAAVVISAFVEKGSRPLLGTAAALLLVGGGEMLRTQEAVTIAGLHGLFVTGEGFETAVFSAVLAWVASGGLWLHGVFRGRAAGSAGLPGARSPLASLALPAVIAATLVAGYFLVNLSSSRVRERIERDFLLHVRTAALGVDTDALAVAWDGDAGESVRESVQKIRRQLLAMRSVGSELARVYLWRVSEGVIDLPQEWIAASPAGGLAAETPAVKLLGPNVLPTGGEAYLTGPLGSPSASVFLLGAPVFDAARARQVGWLGIEVSSREWMIAQASARLQTIALVGLFASLIVFFVAHRMLREHEGNLLVAKERAEAADRAKEEFLAVMSHEMRTPMQSVLGYSELLARTPLSESQAGYLDTIRNQGRTLLRIVQDILDFAILRKSSYTLKSEEVYLHRLVGSTFEAVRPLAARKGLAIDLFIANDVPEVVRGDGVRIEQILLNLLGNAVKFTDHGRIQLDVSLSIEDHGADPETRTVVFSVSDTGMGIRKADQQRMFQPFTRLSYGEHTRREGAGLGLAIVSRLCQLMGGDIQLLSEWGRGSRFFVRLPLRVVTGAAEGAGAVGEEVDAEQQGDDASLGQVLPLRVIVADDNPFIRRLMVEYLRSIGYEPIALTNGADALARWREADLIMMDLRMPVLDGVTAARRIRAESGSETEPWLIGVSATLSETEIARAMEAGMNDFLGKPFFVQSLVEAIKASPLFARRRDSSAAREPASSAPAAATHDGELEDPPPDPLPTGGMSWMPDLSADGENEVVEQAVAEMPALLDEIATALGTGDLETAADRAHYLKNTVFALRIEPMIAPCRAVFERASSGDADAARHALADLRGALSVWLGQRTGRGVS